MATLILTAVGTAVGGPIGGAIGALIGQQADAAIFAPQARQGPRLGELAVQTSSYGTAIPKIFGTMRAAGTVIWSTDLQERLSTSGGGKGRPGATQYSYSASFAVALSGRPVREVLRIWADGKLLRGAGGDFKSRTGFRLYHGDEDQAPDPLIASIEGIGQAPAFRGVAYAMFEDFELADYGNRIPSLTFEIVADEGSVTIGRIAEETSGGAVLGGGTPAFAGFAATGDSVRGAVELLAQAAGLPLCEREGSLRIGEPGESEVEVAGDAQPAIERRAADAVPDEVSIAYHDAARDYQAGLQRASAAPGSAGGERIALPAVLDAGAAKAMAEARLAALRVGRTSATVALGWRDAMVRPGARVRIAGQAGLWRVRRWTLEQAGVKLELARIAAGSVAAGPASPGRPVGEADVVHGPTRLHLLDLPIEAADGRARLLVAAAGASEGWRKAALSISHDGGASWADAGRTAAPAMMGHVLDVLGAAGSALADHRHSLDVETLNDSMWLESRTEEARAGGANLALVGDELIQFRSAEPLAARRFRLSGLWRGRRGTEWATGLHHAGERFVLIETDALAAIELADGVASGSEAHVIATGIGDGVDGVEVQAVVRREALLPPSPVHLRAERSGADVAISWTRRSRGGWVWQSGTDTPLVEEGEEYALRIAGAGVVEREVMLGEPFFLYSPPAEAEGAIQISVAQAGRHGRSRAATIIFELTEA